MSPAAEINTGQKNSFLFKDIFAKLRPEKTPGHTFSAAQRLIFVRP
jgi:hypothetical protein